MNDLLFAVNRVGSVEPSPMIGLVAMSDGKPMSKSPLIQAILAFDGTDIAELKSAFAGFSETDAFALAELCESPDANVSVAATWVVKALCEAGSGSQLDLPRIFAALPDAPDWQAALHLLQSVQFAPHAAASQESAILAHLEHDKTLVRVWALDAFCRLADSNLELASKARDKVNQALDDPKASVRARARHLAGALGL